MILCVDSFLVKEANRWVDLQQGARVFRVVRRNQVAMLTNSVHFHWVRHRKVAPLVGLAQLEGRMTSVEQHVVLDGLQTS